MKTILLALALLLLTGPVQADLFGRYRLPDNHNLEIYYQDDRNIRVNLSQQGYMLFSGDQMYLVMQQGGIQMAMDVRKMGTMVSGLRDQAVGKNRDPAELIPKIKDSGRRETVAGYSGQVHQVTLGENRSEMVLTKDPDVTRITRAFIRAMTRVGSILSPEDRKAAAAAVDQLESTGYGGLLKQSDGVVLQTIETVDRPDSFYRLPPNTPLIQLPMMDLPAPRDQLE